MPLLSDNDRAFLRDHLGHALDRPVRLLLFTRATDCPFCKETEQVLSELAALSDKIVLQVHDQTEDHGMAEQYGIDKAPATVVMGDVDVGVRFYGIPSGYEFNTLIEDVSAISRGEAGLSPEALGKISAIATPVHIQVFATPTCPYCPDVVRLAHSLAMASDRIRADMIEALEFAELVKRYGVQSVPLALFNETIRQSGATPEPLLVARTLQAAGLMTETEVDSLAASLAPTSESSQIAL